MVVHVMVRRGVGKTARDERLDHANNAVHVARGAWLLIGPQHAEPVRVRVHGLNEAASQRIDVLAVFVGALDDLVVDVGNIAHVGHAETART